MTSQSIKIKDNVILELRWIPPGEFLMGSPETEIGHEVSESPQHEVEFTQGFWMSKYTITQQQWQTFMNSNPSKFVDPYHPVEMVSWYDALEFVNRLNGLDKGIFRLPTEAQWEYACRAGTTTSLSGIGSTQDIARIAWYNKNSGGHPHSGGEKEANSWGLYDMYGNVFEWTADWFGSYSPARLKDPAGPSDGAKKVLRGGCCLCDVLNCRAANRYKKSPDGKNYNIGFRVVMIADSGADTESHRIEEGKTAMKKIQVYDPPMCCSTGVCGPSVDEKLVRFSADLDWLKGQGVMVERYNLSQQPGEFAGNPLVKDALAMEGNDCLPLVVVDGAIARKSSYPSRRELAVYAGVAVTQEKNLMTDAIRELVAIGAAIASNCETCFKFHYDKAKKLGVSEEDMPGAVDMALKVKASPAQSIQELAYKYLKKNEQSSDAGNDNAACGPGCCC